MDVILEGGLRKEKTIHSSFAIFLSQFFFYHHALEQSWQFLELQTFFINIDNSGNMDTKVFGDGFVSFWILIFGVDFFFNRLSQLSRLHQFQKETEKKKTGLFKK